LSAGPALGASLAAKVPRRPQSSVDFADLRS
jgi:hypothetical protein